jgi:hypothetical protein
LRKQQQNAIKKGKRGEQEFAAILQAAVDTVNPAIRITRNLDQAREGGCDLKGISWLAIEVKNQKIQNPNAWWIQALKSAKRLGPKTIPVLAYKIPRRGWKIRTVGQLYNQPDPPITIDINLEDFLRCVIMRLEAEKNAIEKSNQKN